METEKEPLGPWPRPRLVVSACLGFAAVRYSGELIPDKVVAALKDHVDFVPVCPEVEIGLGVPRPTVRLVRGEEGPRMVQPRTGEDLTARMEGFSRAFLASLGEVEGFILKNRSPTCALKDAKVYAYPDQGGTVGHGPGLFARAVMEAFPLLPKEDEGRLTNARIRAQFFTRIFGLARLRRLRDLGELMAFHARYKLLLMAYSQKEARALGRLLGEARGKAFQEVLRAYEEGFLRATERPYRLGAMADALLHAFGYFKKGLNAREKAHFLDLLLDFREERAPLEAPLALLQSWALRFGEGYVEAQALLAPYPRPLMDLRSS
ncbi:YbgA family protein [Thermus sp.]